MFKIENAFKKELVAEVRPSIVSSLYSSQSLKIAFIVSLSYLVLSYLLIGFKMEQLVLVLLFNGFYFASKVTRKFILGFSIFIIYWIIFDYMKAFPNYQFQSVSIGELYELEKKIFGFYREGTLVTPNEFFNHNHTNVADVLTGIAYLCWVPVPLMFAGILFFRSRKYFFYFTLSFLLVNLIGFIGYYAYPAAPPWYVTQFGFDFHPATQGNAAGLARFDELLGLGIFENIYSKSSNVFAAMPSLHASYMLIVLYYGIRFGMKWYNIFFAIILLGIWFSAVYNNHHYILDILGGIFCAIIGIGIFQLWVRTKAGKRMISRLVSATT